MAGVEIGWGWGGNIDGSSGVGTPTIGRTALRKAFCRTPAVAFNLLVRRPRPRSPIPELSLTPTPLHRIVFFLFRVRAKPLADRISEAERSEGAIIGDRVIRTSAGVVREFSYAPAAASGGKGRGRGRGEGRGHERRDGEGGAEERGGGGGGGGRAGGKGRGGGRGVGAGRRGGGKGR